MAFLGLSMGLREFQWGLKDVSKGSGWLQGVSGTFEGEFTQVSVGFQMFFSGTFSSLFQ